MRLSKVDLPAPVSPIIATFSPFFISKDISSNVLILLDLSLKLNDTFFKIKFSNFLSIFSFDKKLPFLNLLIHLKIKFYSNYKLKLKKILIY